MYMYIYIYIYIIVIGILHLIIRVAASAHNSTTERGHVLSRADAVERRGSEAKGKSLIPKGDPLLQREIP